MTSSKRDYLLKAAPPSTVTVRLRATTCEFEFGGGNNSVHILFCLSICRSICLPIYLIFMNPSACLPIHQSVHLLSIYFCISASGPEPG